MREAAQSGPQDLQAAVPHRVGDRIPLQDPCRRRCQMLAGQDTGGAGILSCLAFHRGRDRQGSCAHAHLVLREKFQFLHKVYWDHGGIWLMGYFVSTIGNYGGDYQAVRA